MVGERRRADRLGTRAWADVPFCLSIDTVWQTTVRTYLKRLAAALLGRRTTARYKQYCMLPVLLWQELRRMIIHIETPKQHADSPEVLLCNLRAAAHVVDKGLQADNWSHDRGQAAYMRLCHMLERLEQSSLATDPSCQWARSIRTQYETARHTGTPAAETYSCGKTPLPAVGPEALLSLIQGRRSIRSFTNKLVPDDILEQLVSVTSWSPTSCNRQPTVLFITQEPDKVARCIAQCAGATCLGKNVPCFVAVCADVRCYSTIQDYNLPYIDASLGLQNMLLMAHCHGLQGTILNWMHRTSRQDRALRETLGIPNYYLVVTNLIMGYPARPAPVPARKHVNGAYVLVR